MLIPMAFANYAHAAEDVDKIGTADLFVSLFFMPQENRSEAVGQISRNWQPAHTPMAIEILSLARGELVSLMVNLLKDKTGEDFGADTNQWFVWWWQQPVSVDPDYARFKGLLYGHIDEKFKQYFSTEKTPRIRLDEVRWGGVVQDGIPPLRQPKMISVKEATYLGDDNVVFGIQINGDARAYPKRILAWHEMFVDEIGGTKFAGVYCTLCGAVILYKTEHNGIEHHLGTSGFLYRSNKVMYDLDTQSLWNTTWGEPVIGALADKNIRLERSYLVTTTWGEWKRRHPQTSVLSLDTGYRRDYGEGVAYNQYFATDELMFSISTPDDRLKNKDEILALTLPDQSKDSMAISAVFLRDKPVYQNSLGKQNFVVLTDASGANRVFESNDVEFVSYDLDTVAIDSQGNRWFLQEDKLSREGVELTRLPAHRAFWFGWQSAFPETILIK